MLSLFHFDKTESWSQSSNDTVHIVFIIKIVSNIPSFACDNFPGLVRFKNALIVLQH